MFHNVCGDKKKEKTSELVYHQFKINLKYKVPERSFRDYRIGAQTRDVHIEQNRKSPFKGIYREIVLQLDILVGRPRRRSSDFPLNLTQGYRQNRK